MWMKNGEQRVIWWYDQTYACEMRHRLENWHGWRIRIYAILELKLNRSREKKTKYVELKSEMVCYKQRTRKDTDDDKLF